MPKYVIQVERRETYVECIELEAISRQEAEHQVLGMIEGGELSFDGEVVNADEYIATIRRTDETTS